MPFGLANSPNTMVRLTDIILNCGYADLEHHLKMFKEAYFRLKERNLTVNLKDCDFCRPSLKFLGFVVDP